MKEEQKLTEQQKPKLDIFGVMCRLFVDYKKSINWFAVLVYYIGFTAAVFLDGCTWYRFFCVTVAFVVGTIFAWMNFKLEIYK